MIIHIAAVAKNFVIGKDNKMLWHLPKDFKRFKELTMGKPIVMGRKTFESLPGVLPGREHIVITTKSNYQVPEGVIVFNDINNALDYAKSKSEDVYIIGGGEIYNQTIDIADRLELTVLAEAFEGDTEYLQDNLDKLDDFEIVNRELYLSDEKHKYDFSFITWERKK